MWVPWIQLPKMSIKINALQNPDTMKYDLDHHHRRSIRLKGYDYSQAGLYFVTICTRNRLPLFGEIENGEMVLNDAGKMVGYQWEGLIRWFEAIQLHEFVVMPNNVHGIVEIVHREPMEHLISGQPQGISPRVGDMVGAFKSSTTNEYIRNVKQHHWPRFDKKLWQRNYYEHIIRNHESYLEIAAYVRTNPLKWRDDRYYRHEK